MKYHEFRITLGDDNTKSFSSVIKYRKLQQTIVQLKDNQNIIQNDSGAIANIFVEYYEDMLGKRESSRCKGNIGVLKIHINSVATGKTTTKIRCKICEECHIWDR